LSWRETLRELGKDFGLEREQEEHHIPYAQEREAIQDSKLEEEKDRQGYIQKALDLYKSVIPIFGTLAEKYLRGFS